MNSGNKKNLKNRLIMTVKKSKLIYSIYYYLGTVFINLIKLFLIPDDRLILFISYGGKRYDDSPKVITEAMLKDQRFENYKFVWAFLDPSKHNINPRIKKLRVDSFSYYIAAIKSRVWITNVGIERALSFKGKKTLYVNTWHGTPIKKVGRDIIDKPSVFKSKHESHYDYFCVQGDYDKKIYNSAFNIPERNMILTGLPRNDELADIDYNIVSSIKEKLGLPLNKKIILYAPTFREFNNYKFLAPIDWTKWKEHLGNNYVVILRAHHAIVDSMNIKNVAGFVYNFSTYPELNELMIVSDILISDYSSIFFDYSILDKPMFCFTYDYDEYLNKRGLYFDVRDEIPGGSITEEELISLIINLDYNEAKNKTEKFRSKYVEIYGAASKMLLDTIYKNLNGEITNGEG
jgi:CDP-glycerol glycerophosphotransferase